MLIKFSDNFTKYTNGLSELAVEGATIGEGLRGLFDTFPQLYVYLMDNKGEEAYKSSFLFNGEHIWEGEEVARKTSCTDTLTLAAGVPAGEHGGAWKNWLTAILGVVMIIVGVILLFVPGGQVVGAWLIEAGVNVLIAGIASGLVFTFILKNDLPSPNGLVTLNNSAAYTFDGIKNTTASGTPFQLVYGQHRVGGHVLNMYMEGVNYEVFTLEGGTTPTQVYGSDLYAQIGLCEGEIQQVSDVEVNGLPLSYHTNVVTAPDPAYMRMGSQTQEAMPQFGRIVNTNTINRKILHITPPTPPVPLNYITAPVPGVVEIYGRGLLLGPYVFVEYDDSVGEAPVYFDPYAS